MAETTVSTGTDPWLMIVLALIGLAGIVATGWFSYKGMVHAKVGARNATEANDAVNHRKPGEDRLFDMVASTRDAVRELSEWKDRWEEAAPHVAEPADLVTHLAVIEDRIKVSSKDTTDRIMKLHTHVDASMGRLDAKVDAIGESLVAHIADTSTRFGTLEQDRNQEDRKGKK